MFTPPEVAEIAVDVGMAKASIKPLKLFVLGILAGMFIALSAVGANTASSLVANGSLAKTLGAAIFPVGLTMILIAGGELFTGNSLIIVSVLAGETPMSGLLKNWFFVYFGNFAGSLFVSFVANSSGQYGLFGGAVALSAINCAVEKVSLPFFGAMGLAVLCNIVVCVAVWMSFAAKTVQGKIIAIYLPVMLFVLSGLEHCVANMYFISAGLFALSTPAYAAAAADISGIANLTWENFFTHSLVPVTVGNIIGGVLVGFAYWLVYLKKDKESN